MKEGKGKREQGTGNRKEGLWISDCGMVRPPDAPSTRGRIFTRHQPRVTRNLSGRTKPFRRNQMEGMMLMAISPNMAYGLGARESWSS